MKSFYDIAGYRPIDMHVHFDHGVCGDYADDVKCGQEYCHKCGLELIEDGYRRAGIGAGVFSSFASVKRPEMVVCENDYLFELTQNTHWIYQWVVIDPRRDETFKQARKMLSSKKTLGIKIHPGGHGYSMDEWGDKIYSFADELGAVVLIHPSDVAKNAALADKYPNMKLILAHLHKLEDTDAVVASRHQNVYVDTSGGSSSLNNVIEHAVERVGAQKLLFGTDTYAAGFQVGRIAWARICDEDKKLILHDNICNMFPGVFDNI